MTKPLIAALFVASTMIYGAPALSAATEEDAPPRPSADTVVVSNDGATARLPDGTETPLTVEPKFQRSVQRLLAQAHPKSGAVVAVDVKTGNVIAWAGARGSAPAPSVVTTTLAPAASLFKLVTTTALLERHVYPDREVCINGGSAWIRPEHLLRPRAGAALCAPFGQALGKSRNAVFAQLATRFLRRDYLLDVAHRFGFGMDSSLDVATTVGVFEPPEDDLGFARAAAGFVGSRLSPVGAAQIATTIASGGKVVQLRLFRDAQDGGDSDKPRRKVVGQAMSETTARELTRMMEVTVHSGTCREVFTDDDGKSYLGDVRVAGKTGTLQPHPGAGEPLTSWFVAFAPSRAPRVAVSVLLENGPGWRRKANEVGRDVLRAYFADRGSRGVTLPDGL